MKDIKTILKELGIEIPDEKNSELDKLVRENYKTVAEVQKIETARDTYKTQLGEAQEAIKKFEGVDADELKNQISKLTADLQGTEDKYKKQIAEIEFNNAIESALSGSGAKNIKAVKALMDIDTLKDSKNLNDDVKAAIEGIKKENDYLFSDGTPQEPHKNPVGSTGNSNLNDKQLTGVEAAFYARNPSLKPKD